MQFVIPPFGAEVQALAVLLQPLDPLLQLPLQRVIEQQLLTLQVLFGSLQLTFVLIPDHIQTEPLVDPCHLDANLEALLQPPRGSVYSGALSAPTSSSRNRS